MMFHEVPQGFSMPAAPIVDSVVLNPKIGRFPRKPAGLRLTVEVLGAKWLY